MGGMYQKNDAGVYVPAVSRRGFLIGSAAGLAGLVMGSSAEGFPADFPDSLREIAQQYREKSDPPSRPVELYGRAEVVFNPTGRREPVGDGAPVTAYLNPTGPNVNQEGLEVNEGWYLCIIGQYKKGDIVNVEIDGKPFVPNITITREGISEEHDLTYMMQEEGLPLSTIVQVAAGAGLAAAGALALRDRAYKGK